MKTYIALFRGINVGGKNSLASKQLVALLGELHCRNIRTYIQSGNAVFESEQKDASRLADRIRVEVTKRRGFEPCVLLFELDELEKAIAENPFPEAETDSKSLHVGFLSCAPVKPDLNRLESLRKESERFQLAGRIFYLHAPEGVGRSKLAAGAEKLLGVPMTDRNWRTVCKLSEIAKELTEKA